MNKTYFLSLCIICSSLFNLSLVNAQTPIDITYKHAKLGEEFVELVANKLEGKKESPQRMNMPNGVHGEFIRLTFSTPTSETDFRKAVNQIIERKTEYQNIIGGWTNNDGKLMTMIVLNSSDRYQRAICMVLFNTSNDIAVFNISSTKL